MLNFFKFIKKTNRAYERVSIKVIVQVEVLFQYQYENREYTGLLKDISVNGLGFSSAHYVEPGKDIKIEIVLECKEAKTDFKWVVLEEKANVKWLGINHSSNLVDYDIGCEFIEPINENREKLSKMLKSILDK